MALAVPVAPRGYRSVPSVGGRRRDGVDSGVGLVKQRFKRQEQIIAKLVRDRTRLSTMEDIGGCRAVLDDLADLEGVRDRLVAHAQKLDVESVDDYVVSPRPGGYRALHLHCVRGGVQIEVQLRTRTQHAWAEAVEAWDGSTGHDVKHERAPAEILDAFRLMADALSETETDMSARVWASVARGNAIRRLREWFVDESRRGGGDG